MKRTQEEAEQTKQDLLRAGLAVFSQKGFQAATLNEIAQKAGVTRGAIYHHFGSKEELYLALLESASSGSNKALQQAIQEGGTFLEIVTRIIVYTLNLLEEDRQFRQVMTLSLTHDIIQEFSMHRSDAVDQLIMGVSQALQMGIDQGELRQDLDATTAARALIGYQNGLAMLWLANPDAFSVSKVSDSLAEIFISGIAK